jgi:hypothetical protein
MNSTGVTRKENEPDKHESKKKCTRQESRKETQSEVTEKGNDPIRRNDPGGSDRKTK